MICFVSPPPKLEAAETVDQNYILNRLMKLFGRTAGRS
jgi:hypothetical protein